MKNELIGTWKLKKFIVQNKSGLEENWQEAANGLLIYTNNGYMSASLNGNEAVEFYSGKYEIKDNFVIHHVKNATDIIKINNALKRKIKLSEDKRTLELTAHTYCPGEISTVIWDRIID